MYRDILDHKGEPVSMIDGESLKTAKFGVMPLGQVVRQIYQQH